jgi:serine/threonine protein kinase
MVMAFCACSVQDIRAYYQNRDQEVPEIVAQEIIRQCSLGVAQLHENNIAHRDLKPENATAYVSSDGSVTIQLIDLGLAKLFKRGVPISSIVGTPHHMAPEVCGKQSHELVSYSHKV